MKQQYIQNKSKRCLISTLWNALSLRRLSYCHLGQSRIHAIGGSTTYYFRTPLLDLPPERYEWLLGHICFCLASFNRKRPDVQVVSYSGVTNRLCAPKLSVVAPLLVKKKKLNMHPQSSCAPRRRLRGRDLCSWVQEISGY